MCTEESKPEVAVKNAEGKYQQFEVPIEVKKYVYDLEHFIRCPRKSKLKEVYPERFGKVIRGDIGLIDYLPLLGFVVGFLVTGTIVIMLLRR